ncbi:MAG: O-acetyl-ADP-ribose deacetylase [Blastocatellia bacterium]
MAQQGSQFLLRFPGNRVTVLTGDLTKQRVDAIVNAANSSLMGGGGVDGAIHRAGGSAIIEACRELRRTQYPKGLPTGAAVLTTAGDLPARFVIHTVGPVYGMSEGRDAELLSAAYYNSLQLAAWRGLRTIAFPAISTGVYSYPRDEAAMVASSTIMDFLETDRTITEVRLVFFSDNDTNIFLRSHCFTA